MENTMTPRNRTHALIVLCASALLGGAAGAADDGAAPTAAPAPPPAPYVMPASTPKYIRDAVESKARPVAMTSRDANRKPAELLVMSGVKPGDQVLEFAAFGQYFTTLLSDVVGPKGKIYMLDLPYMDARSAEPSRAFVAAHPNTQFTSADYNTAELPQNLDVVFNVLYYHDLPLNNIDTAKLNAKILQALKPGGVFFIVDHNAAPGSGVRDIKTLHRIDPAVIKQEVLAAGFELVEESKLLAHAPDDHTQLVFAPGLRGMTDQSVFKFRKPLKK
jgi:predicted methyltransferase